jgi:thiamine biosynthesis lipoprotein
MASELQLVTIGDRTEPACHQGTIDLLDHLEARWSRFLPDSDVTRLNLAAGHPVPVDPTTITLLNAMIDAWHQTEQRFDPTTLEALLAAGYRASIDDPARVTLLPPSITDLDASFARVDDDPTLDGVEVDLAAWTVRLPVGLVIDAGGIGKGLAADLAVAHALTSGADGAMVSIGGDIALGGQPPADGWTILVEHPDPARDAVATLAVAGGGIATSSTRSRRWRQDGSERHHVIDPWTGAPSTTDLASVTVVARSGWLAEAHATAAILAGSHEVIGYLDRHDLSGVAVTNDNQVLATDDLADLGREPVAATMGAAR